MKILFYSVLFFGLTLCLTSCERDAPLYEVNNLNGNKISAFGHAGMGVQFKFPINSYESVEPCLRIGAEGTEMDIQMTADSVLIAYHHADLNDGTLCAGMVNDRPWTDLWGCHYASPFSSNVRLRSVADLFSIISNRHEYTFTFDCKSYTHESDLPAFRNRFANAIINLKDAYFISSEKLFIESPDTAFLRVLRNKRSDLKLFIYNNSFEQALAIAESMHLYGMVCDFSGISKEQVAEAHEKGIRVTFFNTKTKDDHLEAILKSPDFIQSDDLIYLLKVFGKYKN